MARIALPRRAAHRQSAAAGRARVATPKFTVDCSEQVPGSRTPIPFAVPGTSAVRCAIHPGMPPVVTVR